jgi:ATP-dependent RNA helicase DDX10/DBP4
MEQTPGFDASQILMLILDEADRLLDMGFKQQLDSIIEYLPPRQTLLFSATQTKSVKVNQIVSNIASYVIIVNHIEQDLARLSLRDPEYLAVHEKDKEVTPVQLVQNYIVCKLQDKLDILFSFIKSHLKSKIIVFFSTCSQVRFSFECFRSMQPGIPLTALHGKIKQERRTIIFMDFNKRKHACMLATDIAARGLDFPAVDWVVQIDAPEDSAMYIHRVGRTARYNADGQALLMLLPHEEEYNCDMLQKTGVPIKKLAVNPKHRVSVSAHAAALLVSQPETRALAKKAFLAYIRSLQLLPSNRELDIKSLDLNAFATSLGLAITPDLPMVIQGEQGREVNREKKNVNRSLDKLKKSIQEAKEAKRRAREEAKNKKEKLSTETNNKHGISQISNTEDAEDLFVVRTSGNTGNEPMEIETPMSAPNHAMTKRKQVKLKIRAEGELPKAMRQAGARKVVFDQFGNEIEPLKLKVVEDRVNNDESQLNTGSRVNIGKMTAHVEAIKQKLDKSRSEDAERDQQRVRDMHKSKRLRHKPEKIEMFGAQLDSHEEERMDDDEAGSQNESEHFSIDNEEEEFKNKVIEKRRQKKRRVSGSDNDINDSDIKLQEEIVLKLLNNLS